MRRKVTVILFVLLVVLGATAMTEYLFYRQDVDTWVDHIAGRLHLQEEEADRVLASFRGGVEAGMLDSDEDVIYLGSRNGRIFFWTNGVVGEEDLYGKLSGGSPFVTLGNTSYEVRRRCWGDCEYFALLKIRDDYPYTNPYLKNRFGSFLRIAEENTDQITLSRHGSSNARLICNREGQGLFYLTFSDRYKERVSNYLLITLYLLTFLGLFYVFDLIMKNTLSWKRQLLYFCSFIIFLAGLRFFMQTFRLPPALYRLAVFDGYYSDKMFISSTGDLILTACCVFQLTYSLLTNLRIRYRNRWLERYRYPVAVLLMAVVFIYVNFFNFLVGEVIENMDIHLNVARVVHVGLPSILAFISVNLAGLVVIVLAYGIITVYRHLFSFRTTVRLLTLTSLVFWGISELAGLYTEFWDCLFICAVTLLMAISKYLMKKEIQRSLYIFVVFLLSLYAVMVCKKYEQYKELRQRIGYATELIEERDHDFERHLVAFGERPEIVGGLVRLSLENDGEGIERLLRDSLLGRRGYNYRVEVVFPTADSCGQLEKLIRTCGQSIGGRHFYSLNVFDGRVTYVGRFADGLFIRLDAPKEEAGRGYPQILSRKPEQENNSVYHYSYAKYVKGELTASSGDFVYYKKLKTFRNDGRNRISMKDRDRYSHMLIPVDRESTLVISLPESTFALYYMNVLYAFIVCLLVFSYGLFFNARHKLDRPGRYLKTRIKNNVVSLVFVLLFLLTGLSIYMNTRSFEERHKVKAIELLKYVSKELERLDCVEQDVNPGIRQTLSYMSELLMVDINIYSTEGCMVSTSRPEIFVNRLEGLFVNPRALEEIVEKEATSYIEKERIGELGYMSAYMPLSLENGRQYILNVPYFVQNDELNLDIIIMIIIMVNIAIVTMVLAFVLSGLVAEQVTKPLQMLNDKLGKMRIGGKNEKIVYSYRDEVGMLVREYNNMVDKLDRSIEQLARSERENAWREMARQIAHDIKNPLTPMKLNIQFMLRSLDMEDPAKFKQRFRDISGMLIEQIDNMAAIASAFSDFAKMSAGHNEVFDVDELMKNCIMLFSGNTDGLEYACDTGLSVLADKEQIRRVFVNLLKNAVQSIPDGRTPEIRVSVRRVGNKAEIRVKDNGEGIPEDIRKKIFEPNFTTKSSGSGLGLAICRRIVESSGGNIGFSTELGKGTEFYVFLDCFQGK